MTPSHLQPLRCKPVWFVIPALLFANAHADAALGARVFSNAYSQQALANSPNLAIPGCITTVGNGLGSESIALACGNVSGPTTVAASVSAASTAPTSPSDLAALRANVSLDGSTNGPNGVHPYDNYQVFQATAGAGFTDVIRHTAPLDHMDLGFKLTGTLLVDNPSLSQAIPSFASVRLGFYAQSGTLSGDGSFGSFAPYSLGQTSVETRMAQGGSSTTVVTPFGRNAADYSFRSLPNDEFVLSLGPSFFANPSNPDLYLDLSLIAVASLYAYQNPDGPTLHVVSDYAHTFRMTSIIAYDSSGGDITGQAGLSFASSALPAPVPEPANWAMLTAGLLVAVVRARGFRRPPTGHAA